MAQPYYNSGGTEDIDVFDLTVYFSKPNGSTKPDGTLPGVYDLAGENVQGVYDISTPPKLPPKGRKPNAGKVTNDGAQDWRKRLQPTEMKHWILMHRRILLVIVILTVCVIVGVGVPLGVINESKIKGFHQNTATTIPRGTIPSSHLDLDSPKNINLHTSITFCND